MAGGKVGTAPVRKTRSQVKKERQDRAKTLEEEKVKAEEADIPIIAEGPAQEAIVSRKKKAKREKEPRVKGKAAQQDDETSAITPTVSRPASPGVRPSQEVPKSVEKPSTPVERTPTPAPIPHEPSPPTTPTLTPAQLIAELKADNPTMGRALDSLFRLPSVNVSKSTLAPTAKDLEDPASWRSADFNIKLSKDDIGALLSGKESALRFGGSDGRIWSRTVVTAGGAQLRGMAEDVEQRFLELERQVREMPEELRFRPTKPQNETRFPSFDLRALKRSLEAKGGRGVSAMEQMVQDGSGMKKGAFLVDEASKYINEFVMPPATPPPSAGRATAAAAGHQHGAGQGVQGNAVVGAAQDNHVASVEIAEKQLQEARRVADEREGALRRVIRKNRKLLGLG